MVPEGADPSLPHKGKKLSKSFSEGQFMIPPVTEGPLRQAEPPQVSAVANSDIMVVSKMAWGTEGPLRRAETPQVSAVANSDIMVVSLRVKLVEEKYPALTGGWSGLPDGQLGFLGNPVPI
eukprot:7947441-Pyramimonas_sp.AAC.1